MNSQIERVLNIAKAEIGTKESPPNSNNVKYNTWYYGGAVNNSSLAWCLVFVSWVLNQAGLSNLFYGGKTTKKLGGTASCTTLMNYAKQNGLWYTSNYQVGDLALFDWSGQRKITQHIGIITKVNKDSIETIEGNTSVTSNDNGGSVMARTRSLSLVTGVYRPKYKEDEEEVTQEQYEAMYKIMMDKQGKLNHADLGTKALEEYKSAVSNGITDGTRPQAGVTRQEAAIMAYRAMKK